VQYFEILIEMLKALQREIQLAFPKQVPLVRRMFVILGEH
jgi:hypothetical protein